MQDQPRKRKKEEEAYVPPPKKRRYVEVPEEPRNNCVSQIKSNYMKSVQSMLNFGEDEENGDANARINPKPRLDSKGKWEAKPKPILGNKKKSAPSEPQVDDEVDPELKKILEISKKQTNIMDIARQRSVEDQRMPTQDVPMKEVSKNQPVVSTARERTALGRLYQKWERTKSNDAFVNLMQKIHEINDQEEQNNIVKCFSKRRRGGYGMYGGWYGSYKKKKTKSIAQMKAELIAKGAPIPAKTAHRRAFWEPLYNMYVVNANQAHSSHPKAPIPKGETYIQAQGHIEMSETPAIMDISFKITEALKMASIHGDRVASFDFAMDFVTKYKQMVNRLGFLDAEPNIFYHWTAQSNLKKIQQNNLVVPDGKNVRHATDAGFYGCGVYTGKDATAFQTYGHGNKKVIVLLGLQGRVYKCPDLEHGVCCKVGFDCHTCPHSSEWVFFLSEQILPIFFVEPKDLAPAIELAHAVKRYLLQVIEKHGIEAFLSDAPANERMPKQHAPVGGILPSFCIIT